MPSSTSNSSLESWRKSWFWAVLLAFIALAAMELFWRSHGHIPSVVDDQRLWAVARGKIGKSPKEVVLLGSSRMQTDISIITLKRLMPDASIINLSAESTCANAALYDIAADRNFTGKVIMETTSECIMFGDTPELSQHSYVDYFHRTYNFNIEINRRIATVLQNSFVIINPYLSLIKVTADFFIKKKLRTQNYLITTEDRFRTADYSKLDIEHHKAIRLQKVYAHYRHLKPNITPDKLARQLSRINQAVDSIHLRGGAVAFVRFPVSDEHWDIDEIFFPRAAYWDTMGPKTKAAVFHFKDIDIMRSLKCPDTSHLDVRDTDVFTKSLFIELVNRKIIVYAEP